MTPLQQFISTKNVLDEVNFTSDGHRYFDNNDATIKFTSVTTLIKKFEPEYDQDFWSMFTALKDNGYKVRAEPEQRIMYIGGAKHHLKSLKKNTLFKAMQDVVLAKWKVTTEQACERGNQNHDFLENSINQSKGFSSGSNNYAITPSKIKGNLESVHDLDQTNLNSVYPFIYNRLKAYIERGCSIYAEKRVRLDMVGLAGMIDVPIFKNGTLLFSITDWKTNKDELKTKPGYYRKEFVGGVWIRGNTFVETNATFTGVLSHLPYCKFNVYALQLSIYAYILECWGYKLVDKGLEIIHIRPNMEPYVIKIPYLIKEVELIMLHELQRLGINLPTNIQPQTFRRAIK